VLAQGVLSVLASELSANAKQIQNNHATNQINVWMYHGVRYRCTISTAKTRRSSDFRNYPRYTIMPASYPSLPPRCNHAAKVDVWHQRGWDHRPSKRGGIVPSEPRRDRLAFVPVSPTHPRQRQPRGRRIPYMARGITMKIQHRVHQTRAELTCGRPWQTQGPP
jgi:hypothetical protein